MSRPREYLVRVEDLRRMREAKMGTTAIAKVYGCDQSTVRSWLNRFGMPTQRQYVAPTPEAIDSAIAAANHRIENRKRGCSATLPKPKSES